MTKTIIWIVVAVVAIVASIYIWESLKKDIISLDEITKEETVIVHDIVLEQIKTTGKLELVQFKMKDVLEYKVEKRFFPDAKAVLIISGEAVGCIDLTKIKKEDIVEQDSTVLIRLPKPEICYVKVKHDESRVYNTSNAYFDEAKIIQNAYRAAEDQIERTALQSDILQQTKKNAELVLKPLLESIAKKRVVFTYELPEQEIKKEPIAK